MSKALIALENIKREAGTPYFSSLYDIDDWREDFKTVEQDLAAKEQQDKALTILITAQVDLEGLLLSSCCEKYNYSYNEYPLTKEEFTFLKRYLEKFKKFLKTSN